MKQFESIVNYGDFKDKGLNNNKKGYQHHADPNLFKHTIYVNHTLTNSNNNKPITINISENGTGKEIDSQGYHPSRSPIFHQHLDFDKEEDISSFPSHESNLKLYDPMYTQDGHFIDLSQFKSYLINYGRKYGMQKLKKILHEQFYERIKIVSPLKEKESSNSNNKNNHNNNNENGNDDRTTENCSEGENLLENISEFSITSTELLKELEKEIENSVNPTKTSNISPNDPEEVAELIARCTSFTETDVPYLEPNTDRNPELLTLPRNNYIAPPPSTLILQCCPPNSKKLKKKMDRRRYHPQFHREAKEKILRKKYKDKHFSNFIDNSSGMKNANMYNEEEDGSSYGEESDDYEDIYSSNPSDDDSSDDYARNYPSNIGPNEVMNYKVEMYINKRKNYIEKSKANEKVKEGEENYPVFKDFLYPRWYQHQRYYTCDNGMDRRGLSGLRGNFVVDDDDEK